MDNACSKYQIWPIQKLKMVIVLRNPFFIHICQYHVLIFCGLYFGQISKYSATMVLWDTGPLSSNKLSVNFFSIPEYNIKLGYDYKICNYSYQLKEN